MNATDTVKTNYNKFDNLPQGYLSYIQDEIKKRDNVVVHKTTIRYRLLNGYKDYNDLLEEFINLKKKEEYHSKIEQERFKKLAGVQ